MSASNYLENKILDHVFGAAAYTSPVTIYVSLHTADPGETGANEASGVSYARVAVTNNGTNWPAAVGGAKSNGAIIQFAAPGAGGWGTVTHLGAWDALSAGNFLCGGALAVARLIVESADVEFVIGDFDLTMD